MRNISSVDQRFGSWGNRITMLAMRRWAWVALPLAACATTSGRQPLEESRAMVMAGPRCAAGGCRCRSDDPPDVPDRREQGVAAGQKRFELRTGRGVDPLSV